MCVSVVLSSDGLMKTGDKQLCAHVYTLTLSVLRWSDSACSEARPMESWSSTIWLDRMSDSCSRVYTSVIFARWMCVACEGKGEETIECSAVQCAPPPHLAVRRVVPKQGITRLSLPLTPAMQCNAMQPIVRDCAYCVQVHDRDTRSACFAHSPLRAVHVSLERLRKGRTLVTQPFDPPRVP